MVFWGRNKRRKKIITELEQLYKEFPHSFKYISDMILYAEIGKNRMNLPEDWVSKTRLQCEENEKFITSSAVQDNVALPEKLFHFLEFRPNQVEIP